MPSPRPAGRGAVRAGTRGAGLAATIFDGVAGGSPPAQSGGSALLAGLGRRRDVTSSRTVVDGATSNPAGGAGATSEQPETPAPSAAPWLPLQIVVSHSAFFPSENPNKDS